MCFCLFNLSIGAMAIQAVFIVVLSIGAMAIQAVFTVVVSIGALAIQAVTQAVFTSSAYVFAHPTNEVCYWLVNIISTF